LHPAPFSPAIQDMQSTWQAIDAPDEGGATTFTLHAAKSGQEGFAVRYRGRLYAYVNRCPHAGSPLDWVPGRFFSGDGKLLVCQTHGACFSPDSGACLSGPCLSGLTALPLREEEGRLFVPCRLDERE